MTTYRKPSRRAVGTCLPSATPTIDACSFALDCEWARQLLDKIASNMERTASYIDRCATAFYTAVDRLLNSFIGRFIPSYIKIAIRLGIQGLKKVTSGILNVAAKIARLLKQLLAPWQIRSAGTNILDCLAGKTDQFAAFLQASQLASTRTWQSDGAEEFRGGVAKNEAAAKGAAQGTRSFGTAVKTLGDQAVETTLSFCQEFLTAVAGIISAAAGLPTVLGTAPAAAAIIGLVAKIIAAIAVLVKKAKEIAASANQFEMAARSAVPGGTWPDVVA